jgi:hypothetical protein
MKDLTIASGLVLLIVLTHLPGGEAAPAGREAEEVTFDLAPSAQSCFFGGPVYAICSLQNKSDQPIRFVLPEGSTHDFELSAQTADERQCERRSSAYKDTGGEFPLYTVLPKSSFENDILVNEYVVFDKPGHYVVEWRVSLLVYGEKKPPKKISAGGKFDLEIVQPREGEVENAISNAFQRILMGNLDDERKAVRELAFSSSPLAVPYMRKVLLEAPSAIAKSDAVYFLGKAGTSNATDTLVEALNCEDVQLKKAVLRELPVINSRKSRAAIIGMMDSRLPEIRLVALRAARETRNAECVEPVRRKTSDPDEAVRAEAQRVLEYLLRLIPPRQGDHISTRDN